MSSDSSSPTLRAFAFLEAVGAADGPLDLAELMRITGLPKATAHRIASQLADAGLLVRETGGKRFAPGPRLASLALATLTHGTWRAPRHAILKTLVDEIGETCNLTLLDGAEIVYLDRVEAAWPLRLHFQAGSRVPAHASASGKLLLSLLPARERRRLLAALSYARYTAKTLTRQADLEEALERIRRERLSTDDEEYLDGTVCVAVPVESPARRVPAALAVHAPTSRMSLAQALGHVPALRRAAARLAEVFPA